MVNGGEAGNDYTITLLSDYVKETEPAIIKARKVLLKSKGGSPFTINNSKTRHIISKGGESDLALSNIILDGGTKAGEWSE